MDFLEGWGILEKIPSVREVWIFSRITHAMMDNRLHSALKTENIISHFGLKNTHN